MVFKLCLDGGFSDVAGIFLSVISPSAGLKTELMRRFAASFGPFSSGRFTT
jgi:hypothetical protein